LAFVETGKILPAVFGSWRYDKTYNPYSDIRKNLFNYYDSKLEPKMLPSWVIPILTVFSIFWHRVVSLSTKTVFEEIIVIILVCLRKAHPCVTTRHLSHKRLKSVKECDLGAIPKKMYNQDRIGQ